MAARRNVLETMEDCELIKRYRLNREGIKIVVELVRDAITSPTNRNNPISPEIKCSATLRYLATGKVCFSYPELRKAFIVLHFDQIKGSIIVVWQV